MASETPPPATPPAPESTGSTRAPRFGSARSLLNPWLAALLLGASFAGGAVFNELLQRSERSERHHAAHHKMLEKEQRELRRDLSRAQGKPDTGYPRCFTPYGGPEQEGQEEQQPNLNDYPTFKPIPKTPRIEKNSDSSIAVDPSDS